MYNGRAWTSVFARGQYYLHQFSNTQPDLNLRSSEVKDNLKVSEGHGMKMAEEEKANTAKHFNEKYTQRQ